MPLVELLPKGSAVNLQKKVTVKKYHLQKEETENNGGRPFSKRFFFQFTYGNGNEQHPTSPP